MVKLQEAENQIVTDYFSAAAKRMRLHRERRRQGLQCLTIGLRETEVSELIKRGFLCSEDQNELEAVRKAFYLFLDRAGARLWCYNDASHGGAILGRPVGVFRGLLTRRVVTHGRVTRWSNYLTLISVSSTRRSTPAVITRWSNLLGALSGCFEESGI
jgi:hypothetical protein